MAVSPSMEPHRVQLLLQSPQVMLQLVYLRQEARGRVRRLFGQASLECKPRASHDGTNRGGVCRCARRPRTSRSLISEPVV